MTFRAYPLPSRSWDPELGLWEDLGGGEALLILFALQNEEQTDHHHDFILK